MSYESMMRAFGEVVGRRPRILRVPVLTPTLSSYWVGSSPPYRRASRVR